MRTVALRFAENFAPECGTIAAHREIIDLIGHVWYGKLGSPISNKTADEILDDTDPRFLLIHSGGQGRWWVHVEKIQRETPPLKRYLLTIEIKLMILDAGLWSDHLNPLQRMSCLNAWSLRLANYSHLLQGIA